MIEDFREVDVSVPLSADVCVVGAGAAGIALAIELSKANLNVLILESGDVRPQKSDQVLNEGEIAGQQFTGLTSGRVRAFGGSTRLWFGQCIRLEDIDLEERDWVPYSGWPISMTELAPWYQHAERFFRLEGEPYDEQVYRNFGMSPPAWSDGELCTHFTIYTPNVDLGDLFYRYVKESARIRLIVKANVLEVTTEGCGDAMHRAPHSVARRQVGPRQCAGSRAVRRWHRERTVAAPIPFSKERWPWKRS